MILYHGSPNKIVTPTFGLGEERHEHGKDTSAVDVIKGWRANASYFYIAKAFVRIDSDKNKVER